MAGHYSRMQRQTNFTPGKLGKVMISEPFATGEVCPSYTFELASAVDIGDETITLIAGSGTAFAAGTPWGNTLYEGLRLNFTVSNNNPYGVETSSGVKAVIVSSEYEVDGTHLTIPIDPSKFAIASGAQALIQCYIPVMGAKQADYDATVQTVEEMTMSDGGYSEVAATGLQQSATINVVKVFGDPHIPVVRSAINDLKQLRFAYYDPDGGGIMFNAFTGQGSARSENTFVQSNLSGIKPNGAPWHLQEFIGTF